MSRYQYTYQPQEGPTRSEIATWEEERANFLYHPGNPAAPQGSREAQTWGVPDAYLPHKDAVSFAIARMKRDVAHVPQDEELRLEFKFSLWLVCLAHFLWFRTNAGAAWLLRFFGVEEVNPFWDGYAYIYIDPSTQRRIQITENCGIELRIFDRRERVLSPPITSERDALIEDMQQRVRSLRDPNAGRDCPEPQPGMYHWVSEQLRDWFVEPTPNKNWPSNKSTRISGYQWAKNLERREGVLFYESLDKVELYKERAYRLKDGRGGVLWCGPQNMQIEPMPDFFRHQHQVSESEVDDMFRCFSCQKIRPCLPVTREHHLCCSCYGAQMEKDDRPTLDWCMMRECKRCPAHIGTRSELVNLKNKLNRGPVLPVQRA